MNPSHAGSQYKGVHFSKYSSKRTNFGAKAGPGPGDYDTVEPIHVDIEHYHMKNLAEKKPELNVPRYPEAMLKNTEKEVGFCFSLIILLTVLKLIGMFDSKSIPGPGKYDQKRLFDDILPKEPDIFGLEPERPPFGVQAKVSLF